MTTPQNEPITLPDWRTVTKLTDANGRSYNGCQWGPNVTNPHGVLSGAGDLCSGGFYHGYHYAELAAFLNPVGANFSAPRFWLAEIRGTVRTDHGILKLGASEMRTIREITPIRPTTRQRVAFSILLAQGILELEKLDIPVYTEWANGWLDGSAAESAAASAAWSAESAAWSAAWSAAASAARSAARSAAWSAESAARSAAWSAESAAWSAAWSAESAADILIDAAVLALAESWEVAP